LPIVITIARYGFLVLLWIFVFTVVGVIRRDLYLGSRSARLVAAPRGVGMTTGGRPAKVKRGRAAHQLFVTEGALAGTRLSLGEAQITIGRAEDSTLVITDDYASARHARLVPRGGQWFVEDLGSTNGTFINRVRVREAFLKPGCTIGLGTAELKFHAADEKVEIVPSRKEKLGLMVGRHVKMRELYAVLEKIAPTATTVVIEGETGTGKEVESLVMDLRIFFARSRSAGFIFCWSAVTAPFLLSPSLFLVLSGCVWGSCCARTGTTASENPARPSPNTAMRKELFVSVIFCPQLRKTQFKRNFVT
jgi:pSer/pThr/pTyr-binding forkhead associated (FHA) protein